MRARGGCGRVSITTQRRDNAAAVASAPPPPLPLPRARAPHRAPAAARMSSPHTSAPRLRGCARGAACACAASSADANNNADAAATPPPPPRLAPSFALATPPGDERPRAVCTSCGFVDYKNPKVVVAALVVSSPQKAQTAIIDDAARARATAHLGRVLLCRRAIEPSAGKWGFPQGYLELGESARAGAAREAAEECGARVAPGPLLAVYDVPGSVQLVYLSRFRRSPALGPRHETTEVAWFDWCAHGAFFYVFYAPRCAALI
jgi:ADP-ribose pyrophosphatase YjhB (NUDIX family)